MGRSCCVPGCFNATRTPASSEIQFYNFPTKPDLRRIWIANMGRSQFKRFPFQKRATVCSVHFEDDAFAGFRENNKLQLKLNAVPTLFPLLSVERKEPCVKFGQKMLNRTESKATKAGLCLRDVKNNSCKKLNDVCEIFDNVESEKSNFSDSNARLKTCSTMASEPQTLRTESGSTPEVFVCSQEASNAPEKYACLQNVYIEETEREMLNNISSKTQNESMQNDNNNVSQGNGSASKAPENSSDNGDDMIDINEYLQCTFHESQAELKMDFLQDSENSVKVYNEIATINQYLHSGSSKNCQSVQEIEAQNENDAPESFSCFQVNFNEVQSISEVHLDEFSLMQNSLCEDKSPEILSTNTSDAKIMQRPNQKALKKTIDKPTANIPLPTKQIGPRTGKILTKKQIENMRTKITWAINKTQQTNNKIETSPGKNMRLNQKKVRPVEKYQCMLTSGLVSKIRQSPEYEPVPSTSTAIQVDRITYRSSSSDRDLDEEKCNNNPAQYKCLQNEKDELPNARIFLSRPYKDKFKNVPSTSAVTENIPVYDSSQVFSMEKTYNKDDSNLIDRSPRDTTSKYSQSLDSDLEIEQKLIVKPLQGLPILEDGPSHLRFYKPHDIIRYTGFASFNHLKAFYKLLIPEAEDLKAKDYDLSDDESEQSKFESKTLSHVEELIIVMTRLRLNLDENVLADMYKISHKYVVKVLLTWIPLLATKLEYLPIFPSRNEVDRTTPAIILKTFPHLRLLVDCVEFLVEVSNNLTRLPIKPKKTCKAIIAISPISRVVYFSRVVSGDISEDQLVTESGLLDKLDEGDLILSGNNLKLVEELDARNITLTVPDFLSTPDHLAPMVDKLDVDEIMRLHLKKSLKKIGEFKIFSSETAIPCTLTPIVDDMFIVCCHLANFTHSS